MHVNCCRIFGALAHLWYGGRTDNEIVPLYALMWGSLRLAPIIPLEKIGGGGGHYSLVNIVRGDSVQYDSRQRHHNHTHFSIHLRLCIVAHRPPKIAATTRVVRITLYLKKLEKSRPTSALI